MEMSRLALLSQEGLSLSYRELDEEKKRLAEVIGRRTLVFSLCTNTVASVMGYAAFLDNRIVPALLGAYMDEELLQVLLQTYLPAYIWMPTERAGHYTEFESVYERFSYTLLRTGYEVSYPLHEELALLLTTSGSTGSPKFVRQSYENIRANTEQIVEYLGLNDTERPVTTLPMNYTYGCSILNTHLSVGACILLTDKSLTQVDFWTFVKEQKATSFGGVPYTYEMLDRMRFYHMDLPYLRTMTQAGGKLVPKLHKKFAEYAREHDKQFVVMYGACEATARMGYLPPEYVLEKCGSMGIAIPGGTFTLTAEDGTVIEESGISGELVYEGANVTMGYAEHGEDLSRGDERHGRLETGDIAKRDEDGFYYIVGRKKRFLKIFGNRVNLDEIERLIKADFPKLECASTGTDDHMVVFVTEKGLSEKVKAFLAAKTGLNANAFTVNYMEHIPKNDSGKTLYGELEKMV